MSDDLSSRCWGEIGFTFGELLLGIWIIFSAMPVVAQTYDVASTNQLMSFSNKPFEHFQSQTNHALFVTQRIEAIRAHCIQNRRMVCGRILKVLPDGFIVDSGYTNLMRDPLDRSWLVPRTAIAAHATNLLEEDRPDSVCIGLIFLTDTPKSRRIKAKQCDFVLIVAYPTGQYTYTSIGTIHRTIRSFSASLQRAIGFNLQAEDVKQTLPAKIK